MSHSTRVARYSFQESPCHDCTRNLASHWNDATGSVGLVLGHAYKRAEFDGLIDQLKSSRYVGAYHHHRECERGAGLTGPRDRLSSPGPVPSSRFA